ncbi:MAG: glycerophosphodiester phosphodiesterase, partial [Mesorhizobium sp.]
MRTIWLSLLLSTALAAVSGQALAGEARARQILDRFEHAN